MVKGKRAEPVNDIPPHDLDTVTHKVNQIRPLLAGLGAPLQGVILAELTGIWIRGHRARDPVVQKEFRNKILKMHVAAVIDLAKLDE